MVPPCSDRIARVPPYSRILRLSTRTGLSPSRVAPSRAFRFLPPDHWPVPRSLATTSGVSVDVLSSRYLDVSIPWVCLHAPMNSVRDRPHRTGLPHSEISGSKFARNSPEHIAACYVLHRLLAPRHPPNALLCLISTLSVSLQSLRRETPRRDNSDNLCRNHARLGSDA